MDVAHYLRFVASLVFVIGLILAGVWAVRRFGLGGAMLRPPARRRLAVVEMLPLDAKHRLVLVRRDDREHLLLLGTSSETVVERDITAAPQPQGEPGR
jgi:flagellar protein FliO/FliZ